MGGKTKPKKFISARYANTIDQVLGQKLNASARHLRGFFPGIRIDHYVNYQGGSLALVMTSYVDSGEVREQAVRSQHYARGIIGADVVDLDTSSIDGKLLMTFSIKLSDPMVRVRGEVKALKLLDSSDFLPMHRRAFENLLKTLYKIRYTSKPFEIAEKLKTLFDSKVVKELQERNDPEICDKLLYIVFPELKKKSPEVS